MQTRREGRSYYCWLLTSPCRLCVWMLGTQLVMLQEEVIEPFAVELEEGNQSWGFSLPRFWLMFEILFLKRSSLLPLPTQQRVSINAACLLHCDRLYSKLSVRRVPSPLSYFFSDISSQQWKKQTNNNQTNKNTIWDRADKQCDLGVCDVLGNVFLKDCIEKTVFDEVFFTWLC